MQAKVVKQLPVKYIFGIQAQGDFLVGERVRQANVMRQLRRNNIFAGAPYALPISEKRLHKSQIIVQCGSRIFLNNSFFDIAGVGIEGEEGFIAQAVSVIDVLIAMFVKLFVKPCIEYGSTQRKRESLIIGIICFHIEALAQYFILIFKLRIDVVVGVNYPPDHIFGVSVEQVGIDF